MCIRDRKYAVETDARTLEDALKGADVFIGLSVANCVTREMVRSMSRDPIIFAMANPDPEITYEEVQAARGDVIFGTGRSDYPNQVNNVLGFPFIFRGALDVRARKVNMEMKMAATKALAALTKEDVPDAVIRAYGLTELHFSREYIIPKPVSYTHLDVYKRQASTFASRTASSSNWRPTGQASPWTSRSNSWVNDWRCRPSSNRTAPTLRRISSH